MTALPMISVGKACQSGTHLPPFGATHPVPAHNSGHEVLSFSSRPAFNGATPDNTLTTSISECRIPQTRDWRKDVGKDGALFTQQINIGHHAGSDLQWPTI